MGDLAERKLRILQAVMAAKDEYTLTALEEALNKVKSQEELLKKMVKPIRKKTDLEQIIKEQNWEPIDRAEWDRLVKEMDIQEPVEKLLKTLTK